jgi:release factor glutamine methyltransferase
MLTVLEVIQKTADFFAAKGIESPRLNAELIIGHVLGLGRMRLYLEFERSLGEAEVNRIRELVRRRGRREPLQYVIGECEFHGLKLKVDKRALIPRPETELLVETLVARFAAPTAPSSSPPSRILDLGTGSGAIALALATAFPAACVTALDRSGEALALAGENAAATGLAARVTFVVSDWFGSLPVGSLFDLIVANPPYLSAGETAEATPEVREFEPLQALVAAEEGLADLKAILGSAPRFMEPGGLLALETGTGHHASLARTAAEAGFCRTESLRDLAGRDRHLLAWR